MRNSNEPRKNDIDKGKVWDCAIIGGGPAGLTCGIFLGRFRRRVLIFDSGEPRNAASLAIHGFLGQASIPPRELLARGREEAREAGVVIEDSPVRSIEKDGDSFLVSSDSCEARARRIVLAYGVRDVLPDIPGLKESYGRGIYHCPDCDGFEVSDMRIGVIGSGSGAGHIALRLLIWSDDVTIFTNSEEPSFSEEQSSKLAARGIQINREKIMQIESGDQRSVGGIVLGSGAKPDIEAIFFAVGCHRTSGLAEQLGCEISSETIDIVVDDHGLTSVKGVYAIGDLTPGSKLAITAASDGAVAAIAINDSLTPPGSRI